MKTDDLIAAIAADAPAWALPQRRIQGFALAGAVVIAALVFAAALGPRPDLEAAMATIRFPLKFVVTGLVAFAAYRLLADAGRPESNLSRNTPLLLAGPALLVIAVIAEAIVVPESDWARRLVGTNNFFCLQAIPLIGIGPLALFLLTLRRGAPGRPALAGAVAGLLSGGIAATFYAAHCPDDSPFFVALWYPAAIAILMTVGAFLASRVARW